MPATTKSLMSLTAADLMSRDVVAIPQRMSLRAAAHLLSRARVTGAPVIDSSGCCVGVISATDFMHWADGDSARRRKPHGAECVCSEWQVVDAAFLPSEEVAAHMTADPVTVRPDTRIQDLARTMIDAHIHRVIVVDGQRRPIGIVSGTDVLAAVALGA
jgi:CBS-domain-containing membrane protein